MPTPPPNPGKRVSKKIGKTTISLEEIVYNAKKIFKRRPKNLKLTGFILETIRDMMDRLGTTDRQQVVKSKFKDLVAYHFTYGMHIRNHYGLWREESKLRDELYAIFKEAGIEEHPDSCSHFLIEQMWCRVVLDNVDIASDENIRDANRELIR